MSNVYASGGPADPWGQLLRSIAKRRSYDARFYKPTCLIAVLDGVADRTLAPSDIDPLGVMERFQAYVAPLFPLRADLGWRPFWHLSNDGAWGFSREGRPVGPEQFGRERKPNSRSQLLSQIDLVAVPSGARPHWRSPAARARLRSALLGMLEADDADCRAMANLLRGGVAAVVATDEGMAGKSGRVGRGQGFGLSGPARTAVDRHAMTLAASLLVAHDWEVEDVSQTESFDLLCTARSGRRLHVEVKGTTGAGEHIQLTRNEVLFAHEHRADMALLVVAEIALTEEPSGAVEVSGGRTTVYSPWSPSVDRLTPISYTYVLGADDPRIGAPSAADPLGGK